jgi:hypothetical protein
MFDSFGEVAKSVCNAASFLGKFRFPRWIVIDKEVHVVPEPEHWA